MGRNHPNVKYGLYDAAPMRGPFHILVILLLLASSTSAQLASLTDVPIEAPMATASGIPADAPERTRGAHDGIVADHMGTALSAPAVTRTAAAPTTPAGPFPTGVVTNYAPTPTPVAQGPGGTQDLRFTCPEPPLGLPLDPTVQGDPNDRVIYGCPIRIYDSLFSMGNAAIAVDHEDPSEVIFTSLHGNAGDGRPHDRSRAGGQLHTAFASGDRGITWNDQPPSSAQEPSGSALGSDGDVVLDSTGSIYAAYLYDLTTGGETWDSVVGFFKSGRPSDQTMDQSYNRPEYFIGRDADNRIDRIHLVNLPSFTPLIEVFNETDERAPPAGEEEFGNSTFKEDIANRTDERVVATWHETAFDWQTSKAGMSGWIDVAWTDTSGRNDWDRLELDQLIGPCSAGSNAIQFESKVYVACVVDKGYNDRSRARVGDIDLWSVDVYDGTTELVGYTGMETRGEVMLAQSFIPDEEDNTYVGLLAWEKNFAKDGNLTRLDLNVGYKWLVDGAPGRRFTEPNFNLGVQMRQWSESFEDVPLNDAAVTAFELTDMTQQSLIIYQEWHDDPQDVPDPDPTAPPTTPIENRLTDYKKYFVMFNRCNGAVAGYQAELGFAVDQYNSQQYATNPGIFNEVRDGLWKTRDINTGNELVFFAVGDYGAIQYGAVEVLAQASTCTAPPAPVAIPAAIVPQALTLTTGASALAASAFAVPSVAMIGYLLTVKRRQPSYAAAEDN